MNKRGVWIKHGHRKMKNVEGYRFHNLPRVIVTDGDIRKIAAEKPLIPLNEIQEIYLSEIKPGVIKGWKYHKEMICRLYVVSGQVRLHFKVDGQQIKSYFLDQYSDKYVEINPKQWFAFENMGKTTAIMMNLANMKHSPDESVSAKFSVEQ